MKRIVILALLLLGPNWAMATTQPRSLGNTKVSKIALDPSTLAQIDALTADTTGQIVFCPLCKFQLCISSGSTLPGQFITVGSTSTAALAGVTNPLHCQ